MYAFLENEAGSEFVSLRESSCPVVPHKPYEFATLDTMESINARPMTQRILEEFQDEFKAVADGSLASDDGVVTVSDPVIPPTAAKHGSSRRTTGSAAKKAKLDTDHAGALGDDVGMTALKKELDAVGSDCVCTCSLKSKGQVPHLLNQQSIAIKL